MAKWQEIRVQEITRQAMILPRSLNWKDSRSKQMAMATRIWERRKGVTVDVSLFGSGAGKAAPPAAARANPAGRKKEKEARNSP